MKWQSGTFKKAKQKGESLRHSPGYIQFHLQTATQRQFEILVSGMLGLGFFLSFVDEQAKKPNQEQSGNNESRLMGFTLCRSCLGSVLLNWDCASRVVLKETYSLFLRGICTIRNGGNSSYVGGPAFSFHTGCGAPRRKR